MLVVAEHACQSERTGGVVVASRSLESTPEQQVRIRIGGRLLDDAAEGGLCTPELGRVEVRPREQEPQVSGAVHEGGLPLERRALRPRALELLDELGQCEPGLLVLTAVKE